MTRHVKLPGCWLRWWAGCVQAGGSQGLNTDRFSIGLPISPQRLWVAPQHPEKRISTYRPSQGKIQERYRLPAREQDSILRSRPLRRCGVLLHPTALPWHVSSQWHSFGAAALECWYKCWPRQASAPGSAAPGPHRCNRPSLTLSPVASPSTPLLMARSWVAGRFLAADDLKNCASADDQLDLNASCREGCGPSAVLLPALERPTGPSKLRAFQNWSDQQAGWLRIIVLHGAARSPMGPAALLLLAQPLARHGRFALCGKLDRQEG